MVHTFVDGFQPDSQRSLDMGLFQDLDGSAYLVRSVDNKYAGFSKLTPDYLRPTGIFSAGPKCEGQAVWRDGDDYYLLGSHLTGWSANAAILSHAKGPLGNGTKWTVLGNPSVRVCLPTLQLLVGLCIAAVGVRVFVVRHAGLLAERVR